MRAEAGIERMVGRIADESSVVGTYGEKRRVAVNQRAAEALVNSGLAAQAAVEIIGGAERVVRLRDVMREDRRIDPGFVPFSCFQRVGQFFTIDADLPRQKAVRIQFHFAKFRDRRFVAPRQGFKRETAVFVEGNESVAAIGGILRQCIERIGHVLQERAASSFKKGANIAWERIHGFIDDKPVRISAPRPGILRKKQKRDDAEGQDRVPATLIVTPPPHPNTLSLFCQSQCASFSPVVVVNHKSYGHPDEETDPVHDGKAGH